MYTGASLNLMMDMFMTLYRLNDWLKRTSSVVTSLCRRSKVLINQLWNRSALQTMLLLLLQCKDRTRTHSHKSALNGQPCLPADSPVLIQSGFAMLAIAKISAARNRHPEMIVSLSMSPAEKAVNDVGKCPKCDSGGAERHRGRYQSNLAPFNRSLLLWFCCAFCSNISSFASAKRKPPATKGSNTRHKSITSQVLAVAR